MGFTGLPPSLQGRLRASALPPPPPSATAATAECPTPFLTLPALRGSGGSVVAGAGSSGALDGPSPLPVSDDPTVF